MNSLHVAVVAWALLSGAVVVAESPRPNSRISPLCVILIGGIDSDPTPEQIEGTALRGQGQSGMYQLAGDLSRRGIAAEYFNWNGTRAGKIKEKPPLAIGIATFIADRRREYPSEQLAIVANSWGGHTAWEVSKTLAKSEIPIEMTVFLDPSSLGRSRTTRPATLPSSIKSARNYYTRNVFGWREWPHEVRLVNIDLGDEKSGFLIPGGPKYNAALDPQAHIAAEWDPRIHQEITKYLVELFDSPTETLAGREATSPK